MAKLASEWREFRESVRTRATKMEGDPFDDICCCYLDKMLTWKFWAFTFAVCFLAWFYEIDFGGGLQKE